MSALNPCPSCNRHVRAEETACPFCAAALPSRASLPERVLPRGRLSRAALIAAGATLAGLSACSSSTSGGNDAGTGGTAAAAGSSGGGTSGGGRRRTGRRSQRRSPTGLRARRDRRGHRLAPGEDLLDPADDQAIAGLEALGDDA